MKQKRVYKDTSLRVNAAYTTVPLCTKRVSLPLSYQPMTSAHDCAQDK